MMGARGDGASRMVRRHREPSLWAPGVIERAVFTTLSYVKCVCVCFARTRGDLACPSARRSKTGAGAPSSPPPS